MDWKQQYFEELYHHGTKGMKWGHRKYQNRDGSLTPAGKLRYAKSEADGATESLRKSKVTETNAKRKLEDSGKTYDKVKKTGTDAEKAAAKDALDKAQAKYDAAKRKAENAKTASDNANNDEKRARQELNDYRNTLNTQRNETNNIVTSTKTTTQGLSNIVDITNRARNQKARANSDAHTLTDAELQKAINRMNMEQNYNRLKYDGQTTRGSERAKNALETIGSIVTVVGGAVGIALAIKQLKDA